MASKLQDDYTFVGIVVPVALANGATNPITGSATVVVQPGVMFRISNIQVNTAAAGGNERVEARVVNATSGTTEATVFGSLVASTIGTFKVDAEIGDPIGKMIGPFTTATTIQVGAFNANSGAAALPTSAYATLERVVPSPASFSNVALP